MGFDPDSDPLEEFFKDEAPDTTTGDLHFDHSRAEDVVLRRLLKYHKRLEKDVLEASFTLTGQRRLTMAGLADVYPYFPDWLVVRRLKNPLGSNIGETLAHPGRLACFLAHKEAVDLVPAHKKEAVVLVFGPLLGVQGRYLTLRLSPLALGHFTTALVFPYKKDHARHYVLTSFQDYLDHMAPFWTD